MQGEIISTLKKMRTLKPSMKIQKKFVHDDEEVMDLTSFLSPHGTGAGATSKSPTSRG